MLHCAAMQLFIWKWLCQPSVLFLEATVCTTGYAGLTLDMEYCVVNHRELQNRLDKHINPTERRQITQ